MMDILIEIFGQGSNLNALQMSCRGIVVFFIALFLIRISGRRSFGIRSPFDNIVAVSLGAILSRAIVGASPVVPILTCCLTIVLLHRLFAWAVAQSKVFGNWAEGRKIILYGNGQFINENLKRGLLSREDVMQGVRRYALTEDWTTIEKIYIERSGEISVVKKIT